MKNENEIKELLKEYIFNIKKLVITLQNKPDDPAEEDSSFPLEQGMTQEEINEKIRSGIDERLREKKLQEQKAENLRQDKILKVKTKGKLHYKESDKSESWIENGVKFIKLKHRK